MDSFGQRLPNGVRVRADGQGDPWADKHRKELGAPFYMTDVDCIFGLTVFGANTGGRLFAEYEPDDFRYHEDVVREFACIAMFDRKLTPNAVRESTSVSLAHYLWLCRKLGAGVPVKPRFFYVIGASAPPWTMSERNIDTGEQVGPEILLPRTNWRATVWDVLGLTAARQQAARWLANMGKGTT